jgi:signal transduction histidine kinase/ligand-binding sensor domain-containing protein
VNLARSVVISSLLFLLTICLARGLDPTHRISQYGHRAWRVQDGYFGGQPTSITQTSDGYLWVGTAAGVFRFDGVQFIPWTSLSGEKLPSNDVHGVFGARDGSLWIGTGSGLLKWVNQRSTRYLNGEDVGSIVQDGKGQIWATNYRPGDYSHPICGIIAADVRCYGYGTGEGAILSAPVSLAEDGAGNLWVGHDTAFVRWRPGSANFYRPAALRSHQGSTGVGAFAAAADGSVWVGIEIPGHGGGLQHMVKGVLAPFIVPKLNGETLEVSAILIDRQDNLWVGTYNEGIYRIHGTDVDHFASVDGLSGDYVSRFFEDREGNVWIATSKGIDMLRDLRVSTISKREGLSDDGVESVLASRDGTVWIGSKHLQALRRGDVSPELAKSLPGNFVTSILEDHAGRLWVGMNDALWIHGGGKNISTFRQIKKQDGSAIGMVMGLTEDSEYNIWVETHGPPATLLRIKDLRVQEEFPEPPVPLARKLAPDSQSGIWLGLVNGNLARFRSGKMEILTFPNHPVTRVKALYAPSDGSILGATEFGVVGWKSGKQQVLTTRNGLPCDDVNGLISDNQGDLWLYAACGLIEIASDEVQRWWQEPEGKLKVKVFDALDGVQPGVSHFSGSSKEPNGRLWFANNSVAQTIDPAHIAANPIPPQVHINGIVADRMRYHMEDSIKLPALTRDLEIDYTAPSFAEPKKVLFRYVLEGHDVAWQEPGTRRQAFYNDLRPRRYRFHVIACNEDGVWNNVGATIDFTIAPAWFQTYWFLALCAVVALLIVWIAYRMRVRQVAKAMSVRFDDRLAERTRIARDFHDTLLQTIQGSKLVADSALKQSAGSTPMRGAMEQLSIWLGRATEESRTALNSLRTSTTEENDLASAFQRAIEECRTLSSMEASLSVIGEVSEMHPIVRDEVYRIGYEAIRNACVHSQAARLQVQLTYADDLILRVHDNGVGIAPAIADGGREGHFGMQGMRERADRIMARFTVETSASDGTEIKLVVPGSIIYSKTRSGKRKSTAIKSFLKRIGLTSDSTEV